MRKLTQNQIDTLNLLCDQRSLPSDDPRMDGRTLNGLESRGLVQSVIYANGEFWSLTDFGLDLFK